MSANPAPPTPKGRRTVDALLQAGRRAFEQKGFLSTKIADIAEIAGMSAGAFHYYFTSKEELLLALAAEYNENVMSRTRESLRRGDPHQNIHAAVETFWRMYVENQAVMHGVFQMSMLDPAFAAKWDEIRAPALRGIMAEIRRAKRTVPSPDLDTTIGASALASMIEQFCYLWSTERQEFLSQTSDEEAIEAIAELWYLALYGTV